MSQVIKLDHEYGGSAKIGFEPPKDENGEEIKGLLPLPPKYKYKAIYAAVEKLQEDPNLDINIKEGKNVTTAHINFKKLVSNFDDETLDKFEEKLTIQINSNIQPCLKEIMTKDNLNSSEYFRTDSYFESQRQGTDVIINWKKVDLSESE